MHIHLKTGLIKSSINLKRRYGLHTPAKNINEFTSDALHHKERKNQFVPILPLCRPVYTWFKNANYGCFDISRILDKVLIKGIESIKHLVTAEESSKIIRTTSLSSIIDSKWILLVYRVSCRHTYLMHIRSARYCLVAPELIALKLL